jgi:carbon-monoxide dehydrogenase medium subunit
MTYLRRLPGFEYLRPKTIQEACSLLSQFKEKARIITGGTDLLLKMRLREVVPQYVIGLKSIPELVYVKYDEANGLKLGALTTINAVETSPVVRDRFPVLSQAASVMASAQIRHLATVIGNLCSAVPSADMAPGLIVLGASLKIASTRGERIIAVEDFFSAPGESVLAPDELVAEVQVPNPPPHSGTVYIKHAIRSAMELAIVGVAVLVASQNGVCREVKICLGAVAPTPMRATKAETLLMGKPFSAELVKQAAETASDEARPISDIRSSAEYRREMVNVLTQRALNQAREKAKST